MSKAERTCQFIIEQTAPVFNKQGYAGTSLSDLTAATGLTKGAIYGNFESKEEVALAAFDYNLGLIQDGLRAGTAGAGTAREQLMALPRFYRAAFPKLSQVGGCPILNAAVEVDDAPPSALLQRVKDSVRRWHRHLVRLIEAGQQAGEIQQQADGGRYATLFIALVEGGILLARVAGEPSPLHTTLDHIEQLIDTELAA
ncbi:MAG: TetR/AcrR family transcriptional regulator [Janthinobacterium lividum]